MFEEQAIVNAVYEIEPTKDDYLSFRVKLSPLKNTTYAGMFWGPGAANRFDTDYEFSDGVTIDPYTGLLVIPQDVSSFIISRRISEEDSDEFILSPELNVNNVSVSNVDDTVEIAAAKAARVERVGSIRRVVPEGKSFVIYVNLAPGDKVTEFAVAFTGNSSDAALRKNWQFSNGVRWNADRSKVIVPARSKGFRIIIPAKSDNLNNERQEGIKLTVGTKSLNLSITNVPAGQVVSLTDVKGLATNGVTSEGYSFGMSVRIVKRSYMTSLTVAATGDTGDIMERRKWRFSTKAVSWNYDYSKLLVSPGVMKFSVFIDTKTDNVSEPLESVNIRIGDKTFGQKIANTRFKVIDTVRFFGEQPIEGYRSDNYRGKFSLFIKFARMDPWSTTNFVKVNFGGAAFTYFNWSFESTTNGVYFQHLGNGLFRVINQLPRKSLLNEFTINAYANENTIFAGDQVGWVYKPGSSPSARSQFTVRDSLFAEFQNALPMFSTNGFARSVKELRIKLRAFRTIYNTPILKEKIKNHTYFIVPEYEYIFKENKEQTIDQFLIRITDVVKLNRRGKMDLARLDLSNAYVDLAAPSFVAGNYKETVMQNAMIFLGQVNQTLIDSLGKAMEVRIKFANLLGSADLYDDQDRMWIGLNNIKENIILNSWYAYEDRVNKFIEKVVTTFDQIRVNYSEVQGQEANNIMNIVSAVLGGFAIIGSLGFFVANFRAAWNQVASAVSAGHAMNFSSFFKYSINAPAAFGSATLLVGNSAATIMSALRAVGTGTAGFEKFDGVMSEIREKYNTENTSLYNKLQEFEGKYLDMLHYVLLNGGAGDRDEYIRTEFVPNSDGMPWKDRRGFVDVPGFAYAWRRPVTQDDFGFYQETWGIRLDGSADPRTVQVTSPIALDLLGDGLDFTPLSRRALFDADHDGRRDRIAWIGEGTALLAYDVDGDGAVTRTDEISFTGYKEGAQTDLEGLTAFDSNGDMVFDAHDALWHRFGVWQDKNQDGVTQRGEFVSLTQAGIASISLVSDKMASAVGDVLIYGRSSFTRIDGTTGTVGDVGFRYANA